MIRSIKTEPIYEMMIMQHQLIENLYIFITLFQPEEFFSIFRQKFRF